MRAYETLVVFRPDLEQEAVAELVSTLKMMIEKVGEVEMEDDWGSRKLAYMIDDKYTEGHYYLIHFKTDDTALLEDLDHIYKVNDAFIRSIVIKRD
ncbi:MAG: 30S ribosomal protein S6 [Eubacteriaceae bacterium]|jgi:small subunit ribosomal protein S6|nr:30S ribosomal protein S6 [Eubacteriaceae bacterium]